MPSLHTDSPAATAVVATRSLHREAKSQNDELLLAVSPYLEHNFPPQLQPGAGLAAGLAQDCVAFSVVS